MYLDGTSIVFKKEAEEIELVRTEELKLLGQHNYENVMAAAAMAYCAGNYPGDYPKGSFCVSRSCP